MIDDVRFRADVEGALERHPDDKVIRAINQGGAALRDLLVDVKGKRFFRQRVTIQVEDGESIYPLEADFLSLTNCYIKSYPGEPLAPLEAQDEPFLRDSFTSTNRPYYYDLTPGNIEFLPVPRTDLEVILEYLPRYEDLVDLDDLLDGFDGWEEYVEIFAAMRLLDRDDEQGRVRSLGAELQLVDRRIRIGARGRDRFRADRVKDVRGAGRPAVPWMRRRFFS